MSLAVDEAEHSMELHLPYIREVLRTCVHPAPPPGIRTPDLYMVGQLRKPAQFVQAMARSEGAIEAFPGSDKYTRNAPNVTRRQLHLCAAHAYGRIAAERGFHPNRNLRT